MDEILHIKNLSKRYGDTNVLKNINISVKKGEVVVIIGPSGCGKSTLLRCLNGLEEIQEGEVLLDDQVVNPNKKNLSKNREKIGMVFQQFNLFPQYTALENVTLSERLLAQETPEFKKDKKAILARIDEHGKELLDRMGLAERMNHYPHQLSGGQQQRVAIARALATNPEIIYFDEPTSALDPELIGEVLNVMRQLAEEGMTMLVVTHEMNFARHVSNRVVFMEGGRIIEQNSAQEFFAHPKEARTQEFLAKINQR